MNGTEVSSEKEGWVTKEGLNIKSWNKRWLVLNSRGVLHYFKKKDGEEKGVIDLKKAIVVKPLNHEYKGRNNVFKIITAQRAYYFEAETSQEMDDWCAKLASYLPESTAKFASQLRKSLESIPASDTQLSSSLPSTSSPSVEREPYQEEGDMTPPESPIVRTITASMTDPLPPGWEMSINMEGIPYFIDHVTGRSTFEDPRLVSQTRDRAYSTPPKPSLSMLADSSVQRTKPRSYTVSSTPLPNFNTNSSGQPSEDPENVGCPHCHLELPRSLFEEWERKRSLSIERPNTNTVGPSVIREEGSQSSDKGKTAWGALSVLKSIKNVIHVPHFGKSKDTSSQTEKGEEEKTDSHRAQSLPTNFDEMTGPTDSTVGTITSSNRTSMESGADFTSDQEHHQQQRTEESIKAPETAPPPQHYTASFTDVPLPHGWALHRDPKGNCYFVNQQSKSSQWEHPSTRSRGASEADQQSHPQLQQ